MSSTLWTENPYPMIFPATCFRRASSWSMIPAEVVKTMYPNWRDGSSLTTHFSKSVIRTLYRGEMTPVLLMLLQGSIIRKWAWEAKVSTGHWVGWRSCLIGGHRPPRILQCNLRKADKSAMLQSIKRWTSDISQRTCKIFAYVHVSGT